MDIKTKNSTESAAPSPVNGDALDIQYLLNAFLVLNGFQLVSIIALARMYHRERKAAARGANALLPPAAEEEAEEDILTRPVKEPVPVDEDDWQQTARSSPVGRRASILGEPSLSSPVPEQTIPLLRTPSGSASRSNSQYLISQRNSIVAAEDEDTLSVRVIASKRTRRRGEIWAMLYGSMIVFAWGLFLVTAWLRLRSKEERGGGSPS